MGDSRIGSDIDTITPTLLNTAVNSTTYGVATVGDFLRRDDGYDWSQMQALNLPDYNVFCRAVGRWFDRQYHHYSFQR